MPVRLKCECVVFLLCLASVLAPHVNLATPLVLAAQGEDSDVLKYEMSDVFVGCLKQKVLISNPTSHRVGGGQLFVPLVTNGTALCYVSVDNISSSIGQHMLKNDSSGNFYAYWRNITINRNEEISVEIAYDVLSFSTRFVINSSLTSNYDKSSQLFRKYTQPEEFIQSNCPEIMLKAQEIAGSASNAHEKSSRIYDFVIKHMRYSSQDYERGALWALKNGTGDCSEYSYLFVALSRAAGIPARVQTGFAFSYVGQTVENGHMWAEYYLEGYGWIPVDATWKQFDSLDYRHFSSLQGIPDELPYVNIFFDYSSGPDEQYLEEEQNVSLKSCIPNAFEAFPKEDFAKALSVVKQAKFVLSVARILGISALFPDKTEEAEQQVHESQIHLQTLVDNYQLTPQTALPYAVRALDSSQKAYQMTWELISYTIAIIIGILLLIELVAAVFLRRQHKRLLENS
jgi:transglutaminase-like putative cysteine protease